MASQLLLGTVAAVLALGAASPSSAPAQAQAQVQAQVLELDRRHLASATVEALERTYLECDRIATNTLLDLGSAAHCSMVAEELKHRVFDGDFERLLAWWRANKLAGAQEVSDSQTPDQGPDIP